MSARIARYEGKRDGESETERQMTQVHRFSCAIAGKTPVCTFVLSFLRLFCLFVRSFIRPFVHPSVRRPSVRPLFFAPSRV